MANEVEKVNGIEIGDIEKVSGRTDDNIQAMNGLEFTGATPYTQRTFTGSGDFVVGSGGSVDIMVVAGGGAGGDGYRVEWKRLAVAVVEVLVVYELLLV